MSRRIVLHIDRLVLRGIDHGNAAAVASGLQAGLQELLAQAGEAPTIISAGDRYRVRAGSVRVHDGDSGRALGRAIAGKIAGSTDR